MCNLTYCRKENFLESDVVDDACIDVPCEIPLGQEQTSSPSLSNQARD